MMSLSTRAFLSNFVMSKEFSSTAKTRISTKLENQFENLISAKLKDVNKGSGSNKGNTYQDRQVSNLVSLTSGAHKNLFSAKTAFPLALFRDSLKIDRQKLTIVHHNFFRTSEINSIRIKDIMNVHVQIGPIYGSILITSKYFLNNTQTIKMMRREDIVIAQRMLQGFMIAHLAKIDTDNIDDVHLMSLLNQLGQENK